VKGAWSMIIQKLQETLRYVRDSLFGNVLVEKV
jgi:hypothetical protein